MTFPVANYIDLENGDSENPRNLECMFRKIPGVTGAITHHEHGVTTLYPQVTSSMVTAARLGYNVMHEVPQGMSCSVAAVAESSAGISGYAEYFSQLPSKEKKRAMVDHLKPSTDPDPDPDPDGGGNENDPDLELRRTHWMDGAPKDGTSTVVQQPDLGPPPPLPDKQAPVRPVNRPTSKKTHRVAAVNWSDSFMAVVSTMTLIAGVLCAGIVTPLAHVPTPVTATCPMTGSLMAWDLERFAEHEGFVVNHSVNHIGQDTPEQLFGHDLMAETQYSVNATNDTIEVVATDYVQGTNLRPKYPSTIGKPRKYIVTRESGDDTTGDWSARTALTADIVSNVRAIDTVKSLETTDEFRQAHLPPSKRRREVDDTWRDAKDSIHRAINAMEEPEENLNKFQRAHQAMTRRLRQHERPDFHSAATPVAGVTVTGTEESIHAVDRCVQHRLQERGLAFSPHFGIKDGVVVNALIHKDDDQSKSLWDRMELDSNKWASTNKTHLQKILTQCSELFDFEKTKPPFVTPDGKTFEISIDLLDDRPIVKRAWRLAPKQLEALDSHLNKLLADGVIYPIDDSDYSAVCVLVKKPGRDELRVTTDYRALNDKSRKYAFMSPTAQELFVATCGAEIYSVVDVHSAFYQMAVKKEHQHRLAFSTPHRGMFTYARMPQGYCNSPSWLGAGFHKMLMQPIPGPCKQFPNGVGPKEWWGKPANQTCCVQFVDDLCIYGKKEHHAATLEFIFGLMQKANLSLRPDKCFLGQETVKYLGVVLSKDGLRIDPDKVKALHEAPRPKDAAGVRRAIGQFVFHRDWIENFSSNTRNMTNLLRKDTKFVWDKQCDAEYDYLLKQLTSANCLAVFDYGKEVTIRTDASSHGYGATLSQMHNGKRRTVCYASKRLTSTEGKRCSRDLECGCMVWACSKFRPYLLHRPFRVYGDHAPLQFLKQYMGNNRRLYNYSLALSDYDFTWEYVKGSTLDDADHLSRHPGPEEAKDRHNPDAGFDAECGTDFVRNHIGEGTNLVPAASMPMEVSSVQRKIPSAHVAFYRRDAAGRFEVLTGKETKNGRVGQLNVPGGKLAGKETPLQAATRECREEAGLEFGHNRLGFPSRMTIEKGGQSYNAHVFLKQLEDGQELKYLTRGKGHHPLTDVKWRKVADIRTTYHISDVLRWVCQQRLVETDNEDYVAPPPLRPPYMAPYWGRDVPCGCARKCEPSGSDTPHGSHFYQCRKVYDHVRTKQKTAPWNNTTDGVAPPTSVTTPTPKTGRYNVVALGDGVGLTEMAVTHSDLFTVVHSSETNEYARQLNRARTNSSVYANHDEWLKQMRRDDAPRVDVLACTAELPATVPAQASTSLFSAIPKLVEAMAPPVVLIEIKIPPSRPKTGKLVYQLEKALHEKAYVVDAKVVNSADVGGLTSSSSYWCVAHRMQKQSMDFPPELEKFGGVQHVLHKNADRRLRRDDYRRTEQEKIGAFTPLVVGRIQGGALRQDTVVQDPSHPMLPPTAGYNPLTRESGGGCVVEDTGARILMQEEQMGMLGFTQHAISQLPNQPAAQVQRVLAASSCVSTRALMFVGVAKLLEAMNLSKLHPTWGTEDTVASACNSKVMPLDTFVAGLTAVNPVCCGVLQHVTMPSFREIRFAQQKDTELKKLYEYVEKYNADPNYEADTKPEFKKEQQIRDDLHDDYRREADYFHISNGALMYREILNDEWLTDAIVLPPSMEQRAISAFHDSGYGAHLGAHKTRVALQERVWFPHLRTKVKAYCDKCGCCKMAKVMKRSHAGSMKSSLYCNAFEYWALDLQGPYLKSTNGNLYHCHLVDLTTKWNISIAIPDKKARTVCKAIHDHLIIGGPCCTPEVLLHDQGSEFEAAVTQEFMRQYGIKSIHSTAGHPTGNSVVERGHRTYNAILRTFCHKYGQDWDDALKYAVYAINTHAIGATNISPYEMVYGRKPSDPNSTAVKDIPLWSKKGGPKFLSDEQFTRLHRGRLCEVREFVAIEALNTIRQNQTLLRKIQYTYKYSIGDLVNRWTANPKIGVYGKLAYKSTGPYEIVGVNQRNPNVYLLRPLARPNVDPISAHVRELCPYITREAHEQQNQVDIDQEADGLLEVKAGQFLLLPNGARDYACKVMSVDGPYVLIQYLNTATPKKDAYSNLYPVFWRQNPAATEEDVQEVYRESLTAKQLKDGYQPWTERIHLNHFYQRALTDKELKDTGKGRQLNKLKRAMIRKSGPLMGP